MISISKKVVDITKDIVPEESIEKSILKLLYNESRRKLIEYKLVDRNLSKKYGMNFEDFRKKKMIKQLGYTWEVEKDNQNWEIAKDGIETMEETIKKVRDLLWIYCQL